MISYAQLCAALAKEASATPVPLPLPPQPSQRRPAADDFDGSDQTLTNLNLSAIDSEVEVDAGEELSASVE